MSSATARRSLVEPPRADLAPWYWLAIALLAIKVLWGIWQRDLTFGDTSSYFVDASRWAESGRINIVWSPLYTAYFGTIKSILPDARAAVLVHRLLIVFATTILLAWAAKRMLPPGLAFLAVAWWIALPIHYDTLYEVHLFAALVTIAAVSILTVESEWRLPLWLALYGVATVLVRNENVICLGLLAAYLVYRYVRHPAGSLAAEAASQVAGEPARARMRPPPWMQSRTFKIAILAVVSLAAIAFFYERSYVKGWDQIEQVSRPKHRLNMCQVYAFGYQQRHPEWQQNPWTQCQGLMKSTFNQETPSLTEMLRANPVAVAEHFWWNLRLAPAGLEVLFFNATSFEDNPDYAPVARVPVIPTLLLLASVASLVWLAYIVAGRRRSRGEPMVRPAEVDLLVLLAANVLTIVAVILTQRPRPSYLLGFGALTVIAALYVVREALQPRGEPRAVFWIAAVAAIVILPSYASLPLPSRHGRLGELYGIFNPESARICRTDSPILVGEYTYELKSYMCGAKPVSTRSVATEPRNDARAFVGALEQAGVRAAVLDRTFLQARMGIASCADLDRSFVERNWERVQFLSHPDGGCDAAYVGPAAPAK